MIQKILLFFLIVLFSIHDSFCQEINLAVFTNCGNNYASNGFYLQTAATGGIQFNKNKIEAGFQLNIMHCNNRIISGYYLKTSHEISIFKAPAEIQALYIYSPFSESLRETNLGLLLHLKPGHFKIVTGTNFRTYSISRQEIKENNLTSNSRIHENFNLMYACGYYIKPNDNIWNAGITVTNIDYFMINQFTNPVFYIDARFKTSQSISLFLETWYKSAGAFNISVNYFGFFIRTGLICQIK